jgi:hypothetical protein
MPAKKRKARRPNIPLYTGPVPLETSAPPASPARVRNAAAAPVRSVAGASQIKTDYTYVVNDLKRIAVLGGGLVAVLIVLSFFIR